MHSLISSLGLELSLGFGGYLHNDVDEAFIIKRLSKVPRHICVRCCNASVNPRGSKVDRECTCALKHGLKTRAKLNSHSKIDTESPGQQFCSSAHGGIAWATLQAVLVGGI